MRLFAAAVADMPPDLAAALSGAAAAALGPSVRPVPPEAMHLTLAFIGEVPAGRLEAAKAGLGALSGFGSFTAGLSGPGFFPPEGSPRVLWAGFGAGAERLAEAAGKLSDVLRAAGFAIEERPFVPHLTLARIRGRLGPGSAEKAVAAVSELCRGVSFRVTGAALYSSELFAGGPKYYELSKVDF